MVVSSDTTRIDTEALVDDVLFLRRIREALDSQLDAAHSLNQELCAHQCGGALQRLCALGAQLSEQIGSCADRLAYVASIHAAAEADDARRAMSKAIRSVIWRILVFYVGSVTLLICLLPWNSAEMSKRPFAAVLEMAHFPGVGVTMDIIVFTALVSAFSANIYASSRIAYSLASRGMGPRWLLGSKVEEVAHTDDGSIEVAALHGDIEHGRTPRNAVAVSVVLSLISVALNWLLPAVILQILLNAVGMVLLIVWIMIVIAQIRLHPSLEAQGALSLRVPGWPWVPRLSLLGLFTLIVLMLFNASGRAQLLAMGSLTLLLVCIYFVGEKVHERKAA